MKIQEQPQEEQKRSIPSDVIMDILSRIPARSVMRFRCVSKFWYSLTHDPYFIDMHLSHAQKLTPALFVEEIFLPDNNDIVRFHLHSLAVDNSEFATPKAFATIDIKKPVYHLSPPCNGLIICDNGDEGIDVINLTTRESITILKSPIGKGHLDFIRLTFHSSTKEYKLVRYSYSDNEPDLHSGYRFEVLTLGSDAWRVISDDLIVINGDDIICVNGTMYFLFTEDNLDDDPLVLSHVALMSLDLGDEKFKPVKLPPCCDDSYYMDVLNGNLCIMVASRDDNAFMMDIWVMKEKDQSWSKDYAIRIEDPDKSFDSEIKFVTLRGQEVFLYFYGPRRGLWCFHLGNQSARKIELEKIDCVDLICTYVETLVSLDKFKK